MKILFLVVTSLLIQHIVYTKDSVFRRMNRVLFNLMVFTIAAVVIGAGYLLYGEITVLELIIFITANSAAIMLVAVWRVIRAVKRRQHLR
ncbi:MAG: hypothetical protein JSW02_03615 [candidate division WOR-3 bacterium]|nr:MAG: hypothetical protein JSW02_03615 [candidate division WOR-3 bacterium]